MFCKLISTVFFIGYIPFAPGTIATVFAMIFLYTFKPSDLIVFFISFITLILGIICADKIEKNLGTKDPSYIVIDEFTGYFVSMFLIPITIQNLFFAFLLFRLFDILKPPPIKQIERLTKGGLGIMIDDIIAGVITNVLMQLYLLIK